MSLRPSELAQVAGELDAGLSGAFLQKVYVPRPGVAYLELRQVGRSTLVCLSAEAGAARLSVAQARPAAAVPAPGFQRLLREQLVGARLARVASDGDRATLTLEKQGTAFALRLLAGGSGRLQLLRGDRVLAASPPGGDEPAAKRGAPAPSRLRPDGEPLGFARAAEALFAAGVTERQRRDALAPVRAKLARLGRTLEKVRAEAARGPLAEEHRRLGELLSRNLHLLPRGEKRPRLTEYGPDGPVEREVALDPRRTPKEEVAWHFKEYKRLTRGVELAAARALALDAERATLEAALANAEAPPGPGEPPARAPSREPATRRPFHEYVSRGARIWVGKDARGNDALTFTLASPGDLWLHARGVPGSHVVVRLGKKGPLPQELLLDAAHLALFHSQAKGEPKGEVAYTPVKHVRRVKGGAPGQVTYSQERTFLVRVEPERLEQLRRCLTPAG